MIQHTQIFFASWGHIPPCLSIILILLYQSLQGGFFPLAQQCQGLIFLPSPSSNFYDHHHHPSFFSTIHSSFNGSGDKKKKFIGRYSTKCHSLPRRGETLSSSTNGRHHHPTIRILYESEHVIAIDKPTGIPYHDDKNHGSPHNTTAATATDASPGILSIIRNQQQNGTFPYRGRIYGIHRLDRVTSGILLLAKDVETARMLGRKFRKNDGGDGVVKYYVAISDKKPKKKKMGWVVGSMIKSRRGSWMLTKVQKADGKQQGGGGDPPNDDKNGKEKKKDVVNMAKTNFFTAGLGHLSHESKETPAKTAILFRPFTGKTHQLRVAAKSLGIPILGDERYGNDATVDRTYLHASALHVPLDVDGGKRRENVTVWCPPPFGHLWEGFGEDFLENEENEKGGYLFGQVILNMMRKYCDCEEILDSVSG